jgi:hypothetical protein
VQSIFAAVVYDGRRKMKDERREIAVFGVHKEITCPIAPFDTRYALLRMLMIGELILL